jgi:hypothetical protein
MFCLPRESKALPEGCHRLVDKRLGEQDLIRAFACVNVGHSPSALAEAAQVASRLFFASLRCDSPLGKSATSILQSPFL